MKTEHPATQNRVATGYCQALGFLLLTALPLGAATLMVHDVDVRARTVGAQIEVPIQVSGLDPAAFSAFSLDIAFDPAGLQWEGVSRGPLLAAESGNASSQYAPYWWALESSHSASQGTLRVAGIILGRNPNDNTTPGMAPGRIPAADGVLLKLRFTLLAREVFPIALVSSTVAGRCLLAGDDGFGIELGQAALLAGGTMVSGIPNWWALLHFGDPDHDPAADDDVDWRSNETEYLEGTDPNVADQLMALNLGWNMLGFQVLPDQSSTEWVDTVNDDFAVRRGRADNELLHMNVFYFDPVRRMYVAPKTFEPGRAYWIYAHEADAVRFEGNPVPKDYPVAEWHGWQMIAVPEQLPRDTLGDDVKTLYRWDGISNRYVVPLPDEGLEPVHGYWLFRHSGR